MVIVVLHKFHIFMLMMISEDALKTYSEIDTFNAKRGKSCNTCIDFLRSVKLIYLHKKLTLCLLFLYIPRCYCNVPFCIILLY